MAEKKWHGVAVMVDDAALSAGEKEVLAMVTNNMAFEFNRMIEKYIRKQLHVPFSFQHAEGDTF